jgi:dicarboxylate transporter 10
MLNSIKKTVAANGKYSSQQPMGVRLISELGVRGLYDGLTGTLLRQMTYSMMRFAVYDEAKKFVHPGESDRDMLNLGNTHQHTLGPGPPPAWKMALAGSIAGGVAGVLGNPAELMMVRMQADKAKPIESEPVTRRALPLLN